MQRRMARTVYAGGTPIGGGSAITVQSMTNTPTQDVPATLRQIRALHRRGCDIVRVSVYDMECAKALRELVDKSPVPLAADIHFDYRLAIASAENGVQKLRINPGNIGGQDRVRLLADCAKAHKIPIRIGVNSGSLEKELTQKYGVSARAMVESALSHARLLEKLGFYDIVISLKGTDVPMTVEANRQISALCDYPLHIGVTEAGVAGRGTVKSAVGIGALLLEGIGDTVRVSLSGSPLPEADAALEILRAAGLRRDGVQVISCPTCGRTSIDVEGMAKTVYAKTRHIKKPLTVAVMGCVVNGPGEASHADIGIAGAPGGCALFCRGEVARVEADRAVEELLARIEEL